MAPPYAERVDSQPDIPIGERIRFHRQVQKTPHLALLREREARYVRPANVIAEHARAG